MKLLNFERQTKCLKAFSLIELLVVIAIIAILMAVMSTVFVSSRTRAKVSHEMLAMKQLGQAAELYKEQYGIHPFGTQPLVKNNFVPAELCYSPLDPTPKGQAYELVRAIAMDARDYRKIIPTYRSTYIGIYDNFRMWSEKIYRKHLEDRPGAGWLVSLTQTRFDPYARNIRERMTGKYEGKYLRLMMDTSVHVRGHDAPIPFIFEGESVTGWHPLFKFVDADLEWKKKLMLSGE